MSIKYLCIVVTNINSTTKTLCILIEQISLQKYFQLFSQCQCSSPIEKQRKYIINGVKFLIVKIIKETYDIIAMIFFKKKTPAYI